VAAHPHLRREGGLAYQELGDEGGAGRQPDQNVLREL
jgi:hypothetical protein